MVTNTSQFNAKAVYEAVLDNTLKLDNKLVYFADQEGFFTKNGNGDQNRNFIDPLLLEDQIEAGKEPVRYPMNFSNIAKYAEVYEAAAYYERYVYIEKQAYDSGSHLTKEWKMSAHIEARFEPHSERNRSSEN